MDYIDPANRRLRDEPTLPLSPEEAQIAANLYQAAVLQTLFSALKAPNLGLKTKPIDLLPPTTTTTNTTHEKDTRDHN